MKHCKKEHSIVFIFVNINQKIILTTELNIIRIANGSNYIRSYVEVKCPDCGKTRLRRYDTVKNKLDVRCLKCSRKLQIGINSSNWRGGRSITSRGYVRINLDKNDKFYSMSDRHNDVWEHRYVMAKHLDRILTKYEHVHHKNGIKYDNRIENLELVNNSDHCLITKLESRIKELEKELLKYKLSSIPVLHN